jgi:hypothetical protein
MSAVREHVDMRVWAALRCVDAVTRAPIANPMHIEADGARWVRNRSGYAVLASLTRPAAQRDQFEAYEAAFDPLPPVDPLTLTVRIADPSGRYLARSLQLALPRSPAGPQRELFNPVDVPMYLSGTAPLTAAWTVVRASVTSAGAPARGAVVSLHRTGGAQQLLGRGVCDARGEAVVAAAGVPVFEITGGVPPLASSVNCELRVVHAPAAAGDPDPEVLAAGGAGTVSAIAPITVRAGAAFTASIALP